MALTTQLIPARGRKLRRIGRSSRVPRHNLSPRGDGNIFVQLNRVGVDRHNLSPRGDGNLLLLCSSVFAVEPDTTYPREGTETF